jgi:UDP-GlcNAc:undecaprenyl-phosphate/decaprenyl-phosphate GlcNAc-1-phosphate transferase
VYSTAWIAAATLVTACAAAGLTLGTIRFARHYGFVAPADPWHPDRVALGGGLAIMLACAPVLVFAASSAPEIWPLAAASVLMGLVGLIDDLRPLSPQLRIVITAALGMGMALTGIRFSLPSFELLSVVLTTLWFVGITNAFNLIDNMDGMLPGVTATIGIFTGILAYSLGNAEIALLAFGIAAACVGFLLFNLEPARIFLGDCGSMYLGFLVAGLGLLGSYAHVSSITYVLTVPTLLLAVPIFNTTFVALSRALTGVPIFKGRADHINYRLLAHGMSRRRAVFAVYGVSAAAGVMALVQARYAVLPLAGAVFFLVLCYAGVFLFDGRVNQYYQMYGLQRREVDANLSVRVVVRALALVGDMVLLVVAFAAADLLHTATSEGGATVMLSLAAVLVVSRLAFLLIAGTYDYVWRFLGAADLLRIVFATLAGTAAAGLVAVTLRLPVAWAFLIVELLLAISVLSVARIIPRALLDSLRSYLARGRSEREPVLVVGAGEAGRLLLHELETNPARSYRAVGLLDDDPQKLGRRIRGYRVLGSLKDARRLVQERGVKRLLIAIPTAPQDRLRELAHSVADLDCQCDLLRIDLVPVPPAAPVLESASEQAAVPPRLRQVLS